MKYAKDVFWSVVHYKRTLAGYFKYPEFEEYFIHYPLKDSKYSSHYHFQRLSGANNDILDIGCGEGFFAERIAKADNRVVGIDLLPEVKQGSSLLTYIQADLDQGLEPAIQQLKGKLFDKIILQDVLEHLRHPEPLLEDCLKMLKPNGQILVSVPNVANITIRLLLFFGSFEYMERGILDKTHVRFFTRRTIRKLIENSGYEVQKSLMSIIPIELILGLSAQNPLMKIASEILNALTFLFPTLFGYQCIFTASRKRNPK
jgi:2-polyprenyl-3-methyl-5-hydroxy-6-metoxy-1,4-benzoquinol methylase